MRMVDLLSMSISNLLRRKLRTILTVLGVVIGTASIVVMLSLGLGLRRSTLEQIEKAGGLTTITVYLNEEAGNQTKGKSQKGLTIKWWSRLRKWNMSGWSLLYCRHRCLQNTKILNVTFRYRE